MPGMYILLRNNKQIGPLNLEALLQHHLQPHDLVWVEGQSAGWSYPSEIKALKPFLTGEKPALAAEPSGNKTAEEKPAPIAKPTLDETTTQLKKATHIYVSLPAGKATRTEAEPTDALEAKADALHKRIQAYSEGRAATEDTETHYARSLDDMKQEYGTWLVKQQNRKKHSSVKRNLLIAASLLVVATSGFAISKWIRSRPAVSTPASVGYTADPLTTAVPKQTTTVAFHAADTFAATTETMAMLRDTIAKETTQGAFKTKPAVLAKEKKVVKQNQPFPAVGDSAQAIIAAPVAEEKLPVPKDVKKVIPLSRLLIVSGGLRNDKNGAGNATTEVTLQNNSSETLKAVAVAVLYFKRENKRLDKEVVYFYNVQPNTAPVITIGGNRRATSVRFEIGTITRADGSLYFIH